MQRVAVCCSVVKCATHIISKKKRSSSVYRRVAKKMHQLHRLFFRRLALYVVDNLRKVTYDIRHRIGKVGVKFCVWGGYDQ